MHDNTKMLLFISISTNDMVKYVSMYPEVWFLDCTYGESLFVAAFDSLPIDKENAATLEPQRINRPNESNFAIVMLLLPWDK
jgi:hypothetical protein